jgi:hypothetical protein
MSRNAARYVWDTYTHCVVSRGGCALWRQATDLPQLLSDGNIRGISEAFPGSASP